MSIKDYLREKRYLVAFFLLSVLFTTAVFWSVGEHFHPGIIYILQGIGSFFIIYIVSDFFIIRARVNKMKRFIHSGATEDVYFSYPLDAIYASETGQLAKEFNQYRAKIIQQYSNELDFITRWVHDIKVPISAIHLLNECIEVEYADKLEMQTAYIEHQTQKVLYHIKSKSFYDDYKITKANTQSIISTALKQFAVFFAYKKIALDYCSDDYEVLTDEKWSGYIISQFLSNAVKHTPENGTISINTYIRNNRTIISIKNTGEGIEVDHLDHIFKRGYSSNPQRGGSSSTGYGLYLAKKLADRMGHQLYAVSQQGDYAKFCLAFLHSNDIAILQKCKLK